MGVTIPNNAVGTADGDLLTPLKDLLQGINLLGKNPPKQGEDPGAEVLEANATAIAKIGAPIVAGLGGLTAIGSAIGSFASSTHDSVRIAALASAGAVIVAAVLGFAYIASTDLKSRTNGTIAIYEARKAITLQFLQEILSASQADVSKSSQGAQSGPAKDGSGGKSNSAGNGTSLSQEGRPMPMTVSDVVVALAAAGAKAQVIRTSDQQLGHLAGISCGDQITVKWLDDAGDPQTSDPSELNIVSYTF
jgi:hypothetical protein